MRKYRFLFNVLIAVTLGLILLRTSYKEAIEAKVYYVMGDYKEAYVLAKNSFDANPYNNMAKTVMKQSEISLAHQKYIKMGVEYLNKIDEIIKQKTKTNKDRIRIKMMCEIMIEAHKKLSYSYLIPKNLKSDASEIKSRFEEIYNKIIKHKKRQSKVKNG